jgi:multisubunit Na+/H+ antiporter MnhB subunit
LERADQREQLSTLMSPRPNRPAARLIPQLTLSIAADSLIRSDLQLAANSDGAWRITTPELSPVATATPEAALRALLDAIEAVGDFFERLDAPDVGFQAFAACAGARA